MPESNNNKLNSRVYKLTVNPKITFGKIDNRWFQRFTFPNGQTFTLMFTDLWDEKAIAQLEVTEVIYNLLDFKQNER